MVASIHDVDRIINAYNKKQRDKAEKIPSRGVDGTLHSDDDSLPLKQGVEAAEVYSTITGRFIENILKDEKNSL